MKAPAPPSQATPLPSSRDGKPASRWIRSLRWLVWLALPVLGWWILKNAPLREALAILSACNPWELAALVAFNLFAMLFFSSRWWIVLRALGQRVPYLSALRYRTAAFSINYFTPGSQFGGEPLQVYALQSRHAAPAATAVASVTLDKLFELLANFTFLTAGVEVAVSQRLLGELSPWQVVAGLAGLAALPLVYLGALAAGRSPLSAMANQPAVAPWLPQRLIGPAGFLSETEALLAGFLRQRPDALLGVLLASGLIWLLSLAEYWLALYVLGARLSLLQAIAALTAARLAFLTPLPGGLGALEAGQALAMQALGFDPALGIAISLWIRLRDVTLGLLGLWLGAGLAVSVPVNPLPPQAAD